MFYLSITEFISNIITQWIKFIPEPEETPLKWGFFWVTLYQT